MQTKPPGMQASINRCLSQARINWEGYATGRASGVIWGGVEGGGTVSFGWRGVQRDCRCLCLHYLPRREVIGGGAPLVRMGWRPPGLSVPLPRLSSPAPQNPENFHDGMQ